MNDFFDKLGVYAGLLVRQTKCQLRLIELKIQFIGFDNKRTNIFAKLGEALHSHLPAARTLIDIKSDPAIAAFIAEIDKVSANMESVSARIARIEAEARDERDAIFYTGTQQQQSSGAYTFKQANQAASGNTVFHPSQSASGTYTGESTQAASAATTLTKGEWQ